MVGNIGNEERWPWFVMFNCIMASIFKTLGHSWIAEARAINSPPNQCWYRRNRIILGEFLIWDSRVLAFCRMSTASYMQDATLIDFAKTPLMVSRKYSNCTWLIAPLPSTHHAPGLTHLGPGNPAQFPPREHSAPPIPLFPTRWCQPPVCASVIACCPNEFSSGMKNTNKRTNQKTNKKREQDMTANSMAHARLPCCQ